MQAAWFEAFGAAQQVLRVGELPAPEPGPGEVRVRMQCSGVNPSDVKKRAGGAASLLDDGYVIPHSDGAGVIEAVGSAVAPERVGERVWIYQAQHERRFGTAAQYLCIDSLRAPVLPQNTSFEIGACLGIPAMTAHRCVFADGAVSGQRLLVTGGAGRVGYYAIQFAKAGGAWVLATASNAADRATCLALGADAVINHREANWAQQALAAMAGAKLDRVIEVEFGANLEQLLGCVRTGATIATYSSTQVPEPVLPFRRMMFMDLTLRLVIVYAMPEYAKQAAIDDINRALAAGTLRHRVNSCHALAQIAEAHQAIEDATLRGCVVVQIP